MQTSQFWPIFWSVVFIIVVSILSLLLVHWPKRDDVEIPEDEQDEGHREEYPRIETTWRDRQEDAEDDDENGQSAESGR